MNCPASPPPVLLAPRKARRSCIRRVVAGLALALAACQAPKPPAVVTAAPLPRARSGEHGGTVYVPVYSAVHHGDRPALFQLAVTVSMRNLDLQQAIRIDSVRYHGPSGAVVHDFPEHAGALAPLASREVVVRESDTRGGSGGAFLIDWSADAAVAEPMAQAVMIGTMAGQGISFLTDSTVVSRRAPAPAPERK